MSDRTDELSHWKCEDHTRSLLRKLVAYVAEHRDRLFDLVGRQYRKNHVTRLAAAREHASKPGEDRKLGADDLTHAFRINNGCAGDAEFEKSLHNGFDAAVVSPILQDLQQELQP